ncbi:hypothetical protein SLS57_005658 [Botryosphaeria dothidea]
MTTLTQDPRRRFEGQETGQVDRESLSRLHENKQLCEENKQFCEENERLRKEVQELRVLVAPAESLTSRCIEQQAEITRQQTIISEHKAEVKRQRTSITKDEAQARKLQEDQKGLQAEISRLRKKLSTHEAKAQEDRQLISDQRGRIRELLEDIKELERYGTEAGRYIENFPRPRASTTSYARYSSNPRQRTNLGNGRIRDSQHRVVSDSMIGPRNLTSDNDNRGNSSADLRKWSLPRRERYNSRERSRSPSPNIRGNSSARQPRSPLACHSHHRSGDDRRSASTSSHAPRPSASDVKTWTQKSSSSGSTNKHSVPFPDDSPAGQLGPYSVAPSNSPSVPRIFSPSLSDGRGRTQPTSNTAAQDQTSGDTPMVLPTGPRDRGASHGSFSKDTAQRPFNANTPNGPHKAPRNNGASGNAQPTPNFFTKNASEAGAAMASHSGPQISGAHGSHQPASNGTAQGKNAASIPPAPSILLPTNTASCSNVSASANNVDRNPAHAVVPTAVRIIPVNDDESSSDNNSRNGGGNSEQTYPPRRMPKCTECANYNREYLCNSKLKCCVCIDLARSCIYIACQGKPCEEGEKCTRVHQDDDQSLLPKLHRF